MENQINTVKFYESFFKFLFFLFNIFLATSEFGKMKEVISACLIQKLIFLRWVSLSFFSGARAPLRKVGAQKRCSIGRALAAPWLAEWRLRALDSILLSDSSSRAKKEI